MKNNRFYINNTLLVNVIKRKGGRLLANKPEESGVEYELPLFRTSDGEVCVTYSIERDENVKPLTMIDFLILDTVYGIYGDYDKYRHTFTVRQLIHAITGTPQKPSSKEQTERFAEEIEKLFKTRISINFREELDLKTSEYKEGDAIIENMPLLPLKRVGKNKFKITEKPPLYLYAEANKQVISVPERLFYCEGIIRNTERNLLIKYALLHELEVMRFVTTGNNKYNKKYSKDSIMYFEKSDRRSEPDGGFLTRLDWCLDEEKNDVIKSEADIEEKLTDVAGLHTVNEITKTLKKILDYYVVVGYIEGYELLRRNNKGAVTGIKIKGEIRYPDSIRNRIEP